ncbi:hypothetical protein [Amycolatopsis sp.]|jgi:hypothetical protein|uniref:hypothetical protein n=1 Tax=Amycolatopsis sp. TaxID=37632 RepID=UPI002DF82C99|nr:hypothetical protein [Amycolatopsis sp.]
MGGADRHADCRRCGHCSHINTDGLCRLCLLAIRTDDPGWITDQRSGRACQLGLILPGSRLPRAQPLDRPIRGKVPDRTRRRRILEEYEARIRDRVLRGQDEVCTVAVAFATVRGFSKATKYCLARIGRIALAVRDADGEDFVPADVLDDLPRFDKHMAEIL